MLDKHVVPVAALLCLGLLAVASEAAPRRYTAPRGGKAPAAVATTSKAKPTATRASRSTWSRGKVRGGKAAASAAAAPSATVARSTTRAFVPASPTSDRYREIQQALTEKGYYQGPVDGAWTPDTQSALRRFQADQNLSSSGKLDSLSLIALGLGPKRDNAAANLGGGGVSQ